jgi:hypothetical protein
MGVQQFGGYRSDHNVGDMMLDIENIVCEFNKLSPAHGLNWNVSSLIKDRIHISRGENGDFTVFIEGELKSFGKLPQLRGIMHNNQVMALPSGRNISALKISMVDVLIGNRAMAHISYEFAKQLEKNPGMTNEMLVSELSWILHLLGEREEILDPDRQKGLIGECILLRKMLQLCHELKIPLESALDRWWGYRTAKRDFSAQNIAIEVKTTSNNTRQHHIGSIDQIEPQGPNEEIFIFSVGIKSDYSAQKKLPHFIKDVEALLIDNDGNPCSAAITKFHTQLKEYGYNPIHEPLYLSGMGYSNPHLRPALFREIDLDRLKMTSFTGGKMPSMVSSISYVLNISSPELTPMQEKEVLTRILLNPPVN